MSNRTFLTRLGFGFLLVNLLTALIVSLSLFHSHRQAQERAATMVSGLAQVLEQTVSGIVERIDIVLLTCAEEMEEQLANAVDAKRLDILLQRQFKRLPDLLSLRIVDSNGRVAHGVGPSLGGGLNVADRDYFLRARSEPQAGLIISKPLVARTVGTWGSFLVRRINEPDGSFGGLVYTSIELAQFERLFKSLYLGTKGVVALLDLDMALIARHPEPTGHGSMVGQKLMLPGFPDALKSHPEAGVFSARSPLDGIERVIAYRKVSGYPGYLFVGLAAEDFFGDWRKELIVMSVLMALVLAVSGVSSWLLYVGWKRKEALNRRLSEQARSDALTGCANRRHFMGVLEIERQRSLRYHKGFCLLMLDLDHFKSFNDRFGHPGGDRVLRHFTAVVEAALRPTDTLGRMGGEEFAILLPESSMDAAITIAERIRSEVAAAAVEMDGKPVHLTVSIGVAASRPDAADTLDSLMARADAALYAAKASGRDRVCRESF